MTTPSRKLYAFLFCFLHGVIALSRASPATEEEVAGTVVFTTLGRTDYAFDIYTLPTRESVSGSEEFRVTDGSSVNYNGHFPSVSPALLSLLPDRTAIEQPSSGAASPLHLIYVTDRNGTSSIYYDVVYGDSTRRSLGRRSALEVPVRFQVPLLKGVDREDGKTVVSMKDRPSLVGDEVIYVSTHEDPGKLRTSWAAVYSTNLGSGLTRRLTPRGVADFSPAVSPSRTWTAVASYGVEGWAGEVEELSTDIYVFLTRNGSQRVKVVEHGGWPAWVDDSTLFFHRRSEDGWISVYQAVLPETGPVSIDSVTVQRVTPPGLHAFTPATSPGNHDFIAVATRRPDSAYRHVELFHLRTHEFSALTRLISPDTHHLNPFISLDSSRVGYHKCRGKSPQFFLEHVESPKPNLSLLRIDGSFPSFSPSGDRVAFVDFPGVYVTNLDGSNRRQVYPKTAFFTSWNPVQEGIVYTSAGPTFASERREVDIITVDVDAADSSKTVRKLTTNGLNNAFPSPSPDGKRIVFRSALSGHKNLYIMDAETGEAGGLFRLTEGEWTDTMCSWSPDGEWIAFASDRHAPGSGSFEVYLIHPNGSGLRRLIRSGSAGRVNHPKFSPDGKTLTFTTDLAAISAEPISNPHHYQPYGEIYTMKLDGSGLTRLTHNSYEDGTPTWAPKFIRPDDVAWPESGPLCAFEDCHWLNEMPSGIAGTRPSNSAQVSGTIKCGV